MPGVTVDSNCTAAVSCRFLRSLAAIQCAALGEDARLPCCLPTFALTLMLLRHALLVAGAPHRQQWTADMKRVWGSLIGDTTDRRVEPPLEVSTRRHANNERRGVSRCVGAISVAGISPWRVSPAGVLCHAACFVQAARAGVTSRPVMLSLLCRAVQTARVGVTSRLGIASHRM
jgi:hypothetical protein